jgi:hypothetical protein
MLRRITLLGAFAIVFTLFAQSASAGPLKAKNSSVFTANCGATGQGDHDPRDGEEAVQVPDQGEEDSAA